ncbi:putative uncharacterized protein FLJ46204, partial [Daubentonia madagascariensis]
QTE